MLVSLADGVSSWIVSTYVACKEDIGLLESGWCGNSSIEFAVNVCLSLFFSVSFTSSSLATGGSGTIGSGSIGGCNRDKDTPLAVYVGNSQGELILIGLKLDLSQGFVDDEGVCLSAEFADLAVGDVETNDVGA